MKIGKVTDHITTEERAKIEDLPSAPNAYLEIQKVDTEPGTGTEGEIYYNTTDSKFYIYLNTAWVEMLFSVEEITP